MAGAGGAAAASYPVAYDVEAQLSGRNRLTTAFRLILAIPHIILVGTPGTSSRGGVLSVVAFVLAFFAWFVILFTGKHPKGIWEFSAMYMRWRAKAVTYMALLRDEYPPFGDAQYPITFEATYPEQPRDRLSVGLRLIYAIPHLIVLFFLGIAWFVTAIIGWFAILFTGAYPEALYRFAVGFLRWSLRVESYVLLMRDEYPPFSLQP
jgi:Domain of unknown function (DUF4389)